MLSGRFTCAWGVAALAICLAGTQLALAAPPLYDFTVSPATPIAGQTATFTATGLKPSDSVQWDFDNDGTFDATGSEVEKVFATAGQRDVLMRVTRIGAEAIDVLKSVRVNAPGGGLPVPGQGLPPPAAAPSPSTPASPALALMSPFPVVRIVGTATERGAIIKLLVVRSAPKGARVTVRCRGGDCPVRVRSRSMPSGKLRLRFLEKSLRAGTLIRIYVRKPGMIGKYTSFRIRRGRRPLRSDRCVAPAAAVPRRCPSS